MLENPTQASENICLLSHSVYDSIETSSAQTKKNILERKGTLNIILANLHYFTE